MTGTKGGHSNTDQNGEKEEVVQECEGLVSRQKE